MDGIDFHAFLACKDRAATEQMMRDVKTLLAQLRRGPFQEDVGQVEPASEQPRVVPESEPHEINLASVPPEIALQLQLSKDLMKHARVMRRESTIRVHTTAKITIANVMKMLTPAIPPK